MLSGDFPKAEYSLYAPLLSSEVDGRLRKAVVLHCVKQSIPACAPGVVREVLGLSLSLWPCRVHSGRSFSSCEQAVCVSALLHGMDQIISACDGVRDWDALA